MSNLFDISTNEEKGKSVGRLAGFVAGAKAGVRAGEELPFELPGGYLAVKEFACILGCGLLGGIGGFVTGEKIGVIIDKCSK